MASEVSRENMQLHLSEHSGDASPGARAFVRVKDIGAYQAELYRGAYLAIPKGELEAARACGMGPMLMFRRIIAPQVVRFALPGLNNLWQVALKDSSLISVTGLSELMRVSGADSPSEGRASACP